ncbi:zinc finger BED domain-containing protein RICESLEEPER 2-like [Rhizophagus clarus]|uniref:Zinc finger BED domain-containing protein RICESLEEPER 2-like n=2 Tax=Rhizophagus clarus TaxID=94130 RepID=A0A8H3QEZ1_9GLOM|nr:zinc finger BED domain-containing protein RICESLEEPER 2-like [Rhizophagus clarus]
MSLDDAFNFVDLESDDILDNILHTEESSRKTSPLWNYVDCKSPAHPGVPVCKRCNYVFSIKSSNTTIERHLLNKHNIIIPKVRKQTTLNFKCTDPWPTKEKLVRDKAVVIWIIDNQQPFSVVENEKFIEMMHIFDPRYKIPDRHQIKEMIIDEFNERHSNIGYDLQKISSKVSFTANMWTSTISSEAYLGLTIHYIDQNWVLRRFLLDIIPFKVRHTGINMAAAITNVLNEFNLAEKLEYLRPEIDIETRWNSTYYMLCKLQRMETALKMLAAKHDSVCELMPDVEAWTKIKETVIILEPLERATKNLSGSLYPTIADVRFYFNEIRDHLKYCVEREDGFGQYMLAASINEKLKEYWLIIDNNTTISSILDPRNKISLFEPGEPTTNAIAALREQFSFYLSQKPQSQASLPSTSSREYFRQLKKRRIGVTAETTLPPSPSPDFAEIERYLALPCDENVEALLWWQAHSTEFPVLSLMAKDYLAIQSTSVACEQAFSVAGNTITKVRNCLCPETARASLCTKSWIENNIGEQIRLK